MGVGDRCLFIIFTVDLQGGLEVWRIRVFDKEIGYDQKNLNLPRRTRSNHRYRNFPGDGPDDLCKLRLEPCILTNP